MEIQMAKMASLHAEGYTDKELQEMDEKEIAEILEDILIDKVVHPPMGFRDKSNGE
jgi:hypothetical protein